ncbi:hypothetical protein KW805_01250 [Candidatus Pacearchaeota archaeon]|nr:hypothetical protein [Candidatus Pacearchaeota archaeon]
MPKKSKKEPQHKHPVHHSLEHQINHSTKKEEEKPHHIHHHVVEQHKHVHHEPTPEHHVHHTPPAEQRAPIRDVSPAPHIHHKVHHHAHPAHHEYHVQEQSYGGPIEKVIVENMVQLQKINTDLAEKFDSLTKQISGLLALFETTARSFGEHPAIQATEKDKAFLDKIDKLLEQNKVIAKGLTIMDERMRERIYGAPAEQQRPQQQEPTEEFRPSLGSRPLPRF